MIVKKCYRVYHKAYPEYADEIYADSAGKAKSKFLTYETFDYLDIVCKRNKQEDIVLRNGKEGKLSELIYEEELSLWRKGIDGMLAAQPNANVRIFSGQWGQYWLSNGQGYTNQRDEAGIYSIQDAYNRIYHCGLEKKIELHLI